MNEYLVDRETLGQFVDALIAQKYQNQPDETIREEAIKKLDAEISSTVFGSLSEEKLAELNVLLDRNEEDPAVFQEFFENSGINLQQKITAATTTFKADFLGGENV